MLIALCLFAVSLATVTEIPMTCYPHPKIVNGSMVFYDNMDQIGINNCFPCWEPHNDTNLGIPFPERFKSWTKNPGSNPRATMTVQEFDESSQNKMRLSIRLDDFAPDMKVTVWGSYFFPFISQAEHRYFGFTHHESTIVPADAAVSYPLGPIKQGFSDGVWDVNEANTIEYYGNHYNAIIDLDYYLNQPNQGPMRNGRSIVTQLDMENPEFIQHAGRQVGTSCIASAFLREFDPITGQQLTDEDGNALVARSPLKTAFAAVIVHTDDLSHGINPGTAISRAPGRQWTDGEVFLLGIFDLRALWANTTEPAHYC